MTAVAVAGAVAGEAGRSATLTLELDVLLIPETASGLRGGVVAGCVTVVGRGGSGSSSGDIQTLLKFPRPRGRVPVGHELSQPPAFVR